MKTYTRYTCIITICLMLFLTSAGKVMAQGSGRQYVIKKGNHYLAHVMITEPIPETERDTTYWVLQDATTFNPATCLWFSGPNIEHNYYFIDHTGKNRYLRAPLETEGTLSLSESHPGTQVLNSTSLDYYFYDWDHGVARGVQHSVANMSQCDPSFNIPNTINQCWEVVWISYEDDTWKMSSDYGYDPTTNFAPYHHVAVSSHDEDITPVSGGISELTIPSFALEQGQSQALNGTAANYSYNLTPAYTHYEIESVVNDDPVINIPSESHYYYGESDHNTIPSATPYSNVEPSGYLWTLSGEGAAYLTLSGENTATPTITFSGSVPTSHKEATLTLTVSYGTGVSLVTQTITTSVTVLAPCQNPEILSPTVDYEYVTLSWLPTADNYTISWKKSADAVWSTASVGNITSYFLYDLEYNTEYQYKVQAICEPATADPSPSSFTTMQEIESLIYGAVFGGGRMANVGGNTEVIIINTDTISAVFGGNDIAGEVSGSDGASITLGVTTDEGYGATIPEDGVRIGSVYGGGNGYYAYNGISFEAASYNTTYDIANDASILSMTQQHTIGDTVWTNKTGSSKHFVCPTIGKTSIEVNTLYVVVDSLFGGAKNAILNNTTNDVNITVNGGTIYALFGGNNWGGSLGYWSTENIVINNTKTMASLSDYTTHRIGREFGIAYLFGGGNKVQGQQVNIAVNGGQCDTLFAGGNAADVRTTSVTVNCPLSAGSGNTYGSVFSDAISSYSVGDGITIKETYTWNGTGIYNIRTLFGGNNQADMAGLPTLTLTSGSIGTVYGGGNAGDMLAMITDDGNGGTLSINDNEVKYSTHVKMDSPSIIVDNLYGGCQMSNVYYSTWVEVIDGHVGTVYGGCNISGDVGSTRVHLDARPFLTGTTTPNPDYQEVYGATYVVASGGTVYKNLFAGSNGLYHCNDGFKYISGINYTDQNYIGIYIPTHNETNAIISGDVLIKGNVYAGGNMAAVGFTSAYVSQFQSFPQLVGLASVRMSSGTVDGNVFGGGNMASINGSNEVQVSGGSIGVRLGGALYGGNDRLGKAGLISNRVLPDSYDIASDGITSLTTPKVKTYVGVTGNPTIHTVYGGGNGAYNYDGISQGADMDYCDATDLPIQSSIFVDIAIDGTLGDNGAGYIANVYGGGNGVSVDNFIKVFVNVKNIGANDNDHIGTIYGGNNMGDLSMLPDIILLRGNVNTVYGGCNSGAMTGDYTVDGHTHIGSYVHLLSSYDGDGDGGNDPITPTAKVTNAVYGGCRMNNVNNNTLVLVDGGNHSSASFFGGCDISGNVNISNVIVTGGNVGNVYGGGNGNYDYSTGDYNGLTAPQSTVSQVDILGGQVGVDALNPGAVFGGGYGASTNTTGNVNVNIGPATADSWDGLPIVYGDIYGGSALGTVNTNTVNTTTVNILNGTVAGNIYGGGMGLADVVDGGGNIITDNSSRGQVNGTVIVNISNNVQNANECFIDLRQADIYGCNNTNGSPQGNVWVNIYKTAYNYSDYPTGNNYTANDGTHPYYAIDEVFGGGNQANYRPEGGLTTSSFKSTVTIYDCVNSIRRVFSGGNAAAATGVATIINGGRFDQVFGGGNGEVKAADIGLGGTNLAVHAGVINQLFGGSNNSGTITGTMNTTIDHSNALCDEDIREFFVGGNLAVIGTPESRATLTTTIGCGTVFGDIYGGASLADIYGDITLNINGGIINNVYGGSKGRAADNSDPMNPIAAQAANIYGNVALNIYGGDIGNAYGGSNINGNITGTIAVTVDWSLGSCGGSPQLDNVYGGSNLAQYTPTDDDAISPLVTLINGTVGRTVARPGRPVYDPVHVYSQGRVFGGGKGDENVPAAGKVTANPKVHLNASNTEDVIVLSAVFGGGEVASVDGSTLVQITNGHVGCDERRLTHDNGFVFGGGMGDTQNPDLAYVRDSSKVVMTGGYVHNTVFGGGQIASVGTYNRANAAYVAAHASEDFIVDEPYELKIANTGRTIVDISGGQVGPDSVTMVADLGYVFGAGMGYYTQPGVDYTDPEIRGIENGRQNAKFGYVDSAEVRISGSAFIAGAVWGGSENGQVLSNCGVKVSGGQIGVGKNQIAPYPTGLWERAINAVKAYNPDSIKVVSALMPECESWDYSAVNGYRPYDAYIDDDVTAYGIPRDASTANPGDGHTFFGNVFGGGSGYYPYRITVEKHDGSGDSVFSYFYRFQGRVRGNTYVDITDGHILTSIYGGCEYADVEGDCHVSMTGGTLGVPRTVEGILEHPVTCYLFGAGKGDQRTSFNMLTNVANAYVTVGGDAVIFGSVFGGGEDGHVKGNAEVNIKGSAFVGTSGTSYYDGNIFGGGRGFGGTSFTAGTIGGNATVNISESCKILGNIYGGGRLASVGGHFVATTDPRYGYLQGDFPGNGVVPADDHTPAFESQHGVIHVNISGGTIGSEVEFNPYAFSTGRAFDKDNIVKYNNNIYRFTEDHAAGAWNDDHAVLIEHTTGGNVFGGSMGRLFLIDGVTFNHLWPALAKCRSTLVTINGTARIYGNVYGGGELGYVMDSTNVVIDGTAEIGYAIGTMPDIRYTGSIYGGGYGSSNITPHTNDTMGLGGLSVTAAMHSGRVYGNTRVTMNNGHVWGNIYGGGEMASVGRRWINMALNGDANNYLPFVGRENGEYSDGYTTYTQYAWIDAVGNTRVTISGGTVGDTLHTHINTERQPGWVAGNTGSVFGGGKGHPGRVGEDFHFTRMAYVDSSQVTISGTARIAASVFGGGENGHVRYGTRVVVHNGTIGVPLDFSEVMTDKYGYSPTSVYHGNVYGGGRGVDVTSEDHLGVAAGQVYGNTVVLVDGGKVLHNVYGGGSLASVGRRNNDGSYEEGTGNANVTITGNAIIGSTLSRDVAAAMLGGTPTEEQITAMQNSYYGINNGRVFGSGRGMAGANFADRAYTHNTTVTIGDDSPTGTCHIYGAVFGSGENGHVQDSTDVYIKKGCLIGEKWESLTRDSDKELVGNVYGGGRGVDLSGGHISATAGIVKGNTNVEVSGGWIYHNVFGGGSLASVGEESDMSKGQTTILVTGGIIGTNGVNNGNVFGGGRGNAGQSNYSPIESPHSTEGFTSGSVTIGGEPYTIYYKDRGDGKIVSYRVTTLEEMGYEGTNPVWVVGKVRNSAGVEYQDSTVLRDYTRLTFVNGTSVTVTYPAAGPTTWSNTTWYPETRTTLYNPMSNYNTALANTVTATAGQEYIHGNVFGGGDNGHVRGNTAVVINQGRIGTLTSNSNGNVFGGGRGEGRSFDGTFSYYAGRVEGTTTVTINDGWILHNVYGGGNMASVGNFEVELDDNNDGDPSTIESTDKNDWLNGGYDVVRYTTTGGLCTVNINGGHIGEQEDKIMNGENVINGMDSRDANLGGNVFGSSRGQSLSEATVRRMAWVNMTVVNINSSSHAVYGSVFGGGENGHVFYTATVNINDGYVGVPNTASSGDIYRGNVYGGGRGIDPVDGGNTFSRSSGLILGNTYVNMVGGTVYRNLFGGGSMATVGTYTYKNGSGDDRDEIVRLDRPETGKTEVNISGGIVGINGSNNGRVFGAGRGVAGLQGESMLDAHTYVDRTYVTISGTAEIRGCVFGSGDNGHVLDSTQVVIIGGTIGTGDGGPVNGNVFGSGRGSDTYLNNSSVPTLSPNAGRVGRETKVYVLGGTIKNNIYGGGYLASVAGNTSVTVAPSAEVYKENWGYNDGGIPIDNGDHMTINGTAPILVYGDVFGGSALGEMGNADDTTTVNILGGTIGSSSSYKYSSTLGCGNIFGGGNGDAESNTMDSYSNGTTEGKREANVLNTVQVNIGDPSQYNDNSKGATILGSVFGGNNIAGSPKGNIYVDVYSTAHTDANAYSAVKGFAAPFDKVDTNDLSVVEGYADSRFALAAVYGGGNKAAIIPTATSGTTTTVVIHECNENTIKYVYGGGNAADLGDNTHTMRTDVTIEGGHIYQAFAGGNGAGVGNPGANVFGDASILVTGGAVNQVFGGSNSLGDITGISSLTFDGVNDANCDQVNIDAFGGGNRATNSGNIEVTILCSSKGLNNVYGAGNAADFDGDITVNVLGGQMKNLYGGARAANIHGNVTVNVFSGEIGSVFGGNNESGYIFGTNMDGTPNLNKGNIEVNIDIEEQRCTYPNKIGYVYGGGNMAAYKPELTTTWSTDVDGSFVLGSPTFSYNASRLSPVVNIISGQVDTAVFGGGWGTTATVIANPKVVVGAERVQQWNDVLNTIEPVTPPVPNNMVIIGSATHNEGTRIWGNVFGGGNAAPVEGNTSVYIIGNTNVRNNVYGGGNAATVNGSTHVTIGETTCE